MSLIDILIPLLGGFYLIFFGKNLVGTITPHRYPLEKTTKITQWTGITLVIASIVLLAAYLLE